MASMRRLFLYLPHKAIPLFFVVVLFALTDVPLNPASADSRLPAHPDILAEQAAAVPRVTATRMVEYATGADVLEAYHVQAELMIHAGAAEAFRPHIVATVVIAVDRSRTDASIAGWRDLLSRDVAVGLPIAQPLLEYISAAISYGLTGTYDLQAAMRYFNRLASDNRLLTQTDHSSAPVRVTLSDEVPQGWAVIVPVEGTLYFEKGLLFRSRADAASAPNSSADPPKNAIRADATQLERFQPMWAYVRRTYLNERRYSTASGWEHQVSALISLIGISLWITHMRIRADLSGMRRIVTAIGCLEIGWICVRVAKYLIVDVTALGRYLWYSFYIFQVAIALLFLLLSLQLGETRIAKGRRGRALIASVALLGGALVCLIFTNDLHQWAFSFPEGWARWSKAYQYGLAYYAMLAYAYLLTALSVGILLRRCRYAPRRKGAVLASLVLVGLLAYSIGYILRLPLMWESDMTLVTCWFILLFMESAFQSGLIPLNSGHRRLFERADLGIQLIDARGIPILRTPDAIAVEGETIDKLLRSGEGTHFDNGREFNLYAAPITGGHVLWQEDVGELVTLNRILDQTNAELDRQQRALREEERIRGELASLNARNQLYAEIEETISDRLNHMRERLIGMVGANEADSRLAIVRINMLASAIKRSCGMLLREKRDECIPADDLAMALSEMAEFIGYAGTQCVTLFDLMGGIPCTAARMIYECFIHLCEGAIDGEHDQVIARLYREKGRVCLLMMAERQWLNDHRAADLRTLTRSIDAEITAKDLDDMHSVLITCPLTGETHA